MRELLKRRRKMHKEGRIRSGGTVVDLPLGKKVDSAHMRVVSYVDNKG